MSENIAPAAAPAQEQPAGPITASASYFQATKADVTQYKAEAPAAESVVDAQPAEPAAATEVAEKPYNPQETLRTVQEHVPHVGAYELRLAEGLISKSLNAAQSNPMTPQAIAEGHTQCMNYLHSKHGEAKAANLVTMAQQELAQLATKMPGLPQILETSGRGNDPWLVEQLAQMHVKRQFARTK